MKEIILAIQEEYNGACESGKPFYITKEMLQRLKLAENELKNLKELIKRKPFRK